MRGYLKRLVATGAAYQVGDIVAKGIALFTLPLYTRHVSPAGYGAANSLLTAVILSSILLRVGVGEAFIRFYFDDDDVARRERIARTATATVAWTTTLAALVGGRASPAPLSRLLLGFRDPLLLDCAMLGLWAFTNLEMAYAQLRVDERARTYVFASGANVALTVIFTVALVVFAGQGARGLLLGNFGASALVVLGLWWVLRRRFSPARALAGPARDAALRAADGARRRERVRAAGRRPLLPVPRLLARGRGRVRGRDAARDGRVRRRARLPVRVAAAGLLDRAATPRPRACTRWSRPTSCSRRASSSRRSRCSGAGSCACSPRRSTSARTRALPWLALGWALYGLYLVIIVITGRARVTARNLPAAPPGWRSTSCCCSCSCRARRRPGHRRRRASRCAAPTWRCSPSCTC